jgi:putative endonuclease
VADPRHLLGLRAEEAAAAWLTGQGWQVLARRWRCERGELDLICLDQVGTLVGIEVKCRRNDRVGAPGEAVDGRRLARLRSTLAAFQTQRIEAPRSLRVDLVTVSALPGQSSWRLARIAQIDAW